MTLNGTGNCAQIAFEKLANCHWTASSVECCFPRSRTSFLFRLIKESQTLPPLCFYTLIKRERFGGSVPCEFTSCEIKYDLFSLHRHVRQNKQTDGRTDRQMRPRICGSPQKTANKKTKQQTKGLQIEFARGLFCL